MGLKTLQPRFRIQRPLEFVRVLTSGLLFFRSKRIENFIEIADSTMGNEYHVIAFSHSPELATQLNQNFDHHLMRHLINTLASIYG